MIDDLKAKAKDLSNNGFVWNLFFTHLCRPVYRFCRLLWHVSVFSLKLLRVFGFFRTIRIYANFFRAAATRSYINSRIRREIVRLANVDTKMAGSAVYEGFLYHDFPFPDRFVYKAHRNNSIDRLRKIVKYVSFRERRVLDIGCSNGTISLGAGMLGAIRVIGIDHDQQALRVGEAMKDKYRLGNVEFKCQAIMPNQLNLPETDVLIWLSNWMWLVKAYGLEKGLDLLYDVPYLCCAETMVFESAADDGMAAIKGTTQKDIERFLKENTPFSVIRNVGPFKDKWRAKGKERDVFICTNRMVFYRGKQAVIERVNRGTICKTFEDAKLWAMDIEIQCLKRLEKFSYFPTILAIDDNWYEMVYCGEPVERSEQLVDLLEIVRILKENHIVHRDMNPKNLLFLDGKLSLVDFGWAVIDGKKPRDYLPEGLGRGFYDEGDFDDAIAAERIKRSFNG